MYLLYIYISTVLVMLLLYTRTLLIFSQQYKHLNKLIFVKNGNQVYGGEDHYFTWFLRDNSFMISYKGYDYFLHNFLLWKLFLPLHWYWLWKYEKWFKNNVDVSKLKSL